MILEADNLTKVFDSLEVLKGISLQVHPNETIAIMGKSGCGKSTLLHILGTLEAPTNGSLRICGQSTKNLSTLRNKHIGFIFQAYHLLEDFTVLDNVLMPLKIARNESKEGVARAKELLKEAGLEGKEGVLAKHLSGGEKQRVAIVRAIVNQPDLLLADEPTGNLDRGYSVEIQNLLLNKAKQLGKALIVVTHDEDFARKCDRILFLKDGRLYNSLT